MTPADGSDARMAVYEMCRDAAERHRAGDVAAAAATFEEVVVTFGDSTDDYVRGLVVSSIGHRASIRVRNPDIAARTEPTPNLVAHLNRTESAELRATLAQAITNEAQVLALERPEQALALEQDLVDAISDTDAPEVRIHAAMAAQNVVNLLRGEGREADAEQALRTVAERFGKELLVTYDETIAENGAADRDTRLGIRFRRAEVLRAMGRTPEAVEGYEEVISEFEDDDEVKSVVDRAREWRARLTVEDQAAR
jgi:tetratricopeptide (TPR) repeat protein